MTIKRGEIYFVNLNPVKEREQAGKRPVLVLSILSTTLKLSITNQKTIKRSHYLVLKILGELRSLDSGKDLLSNHQR